MPVPSLRFALFVATAALGWQSPAVAQPGKANPHFYKGVEVVCVGIDKHASRGVGDLTQAVKDAKDVANTLEKKYGYKPKLLLDKAATKQAILDALDELDARPTPPEAVILYFACHGTSFEFPDKKSPVPMRVGYLIPHDADVDLKDTSRPERWAQEALSMRELVDRVEKMKARHVVLIADACCSGYLTKRGSVAAAPQLFPLLSEPSRTVLAATTQRESALEGVFTKGLLSILVAAADNPEPDAQSVTDVFQNLRAVVSKDERGALMTPQMAHVGAGDGEFVFIPTTVTGKEVELLSASVAEYRQGKKPQAAGQLVSFRGIGERQQKRHGRQTRPADLAAALAAEDYRYSAAAEAGAAQWEGARRGFTENAALGDPWAMAGLSVCAARGLGGDAAPKDAYFWARQADQFAKPAGLGSYLLARCYELGLGVAKNEVTAEKLYQAAADAKFPFALLRRAERVAAKVTASGPPLPAADRAAAEKDLRDAFDAGIVAAAVPLFRFYVYDPNSNLETNAPVIKMLETAAERGAAEAHQLLWLIYAKGTKSLPPKDMTRAKGHLAQAANLGRAAAQRTLAIEYYRKTGEFFTTTPSTDLAQDFREARQWAELAARQNDGGGHFVLAQLYRTGSGGAVDHDKYRTHLDEASRLKWADAMHELFWELCRGKVYKQDFARALQTAEQSADLGHATGHYDLGYYYLALLHPTTGKVTLKEGVEKFLFNDHENTYRTLHHYWQAYKIGKHPGAKKFLENYWESHAKNLGNLVTDKELEKHYPESAKELFASTDFDKKK